MKYWVIGCLAFIYPSFLLGDEIEFELPQEFLPEELLEENQIRGDYHVVESPVVVEDYCFLFTVNSSFGRYEVWGSPIELAALVQEIEAIGKLKEIEQTEAFSKSFTEAVKSPVVKTWTAATHPVRTVTGLPGGVSRYLKGTFYKVKKGSEMVVSGARKMASEMDVKSNDGPSLGHRATAVTIEAGKEFGGYYKATRTWSKRLNVDPYSYNIALQDELGRIGWASAVGEFASDFVIPSSDSISYVQKGLNAVWDNDPIEVERQNVSALRKIGVSKKMIRQFNELDRYSLTEKTTIMLNLRQMDGVKGRVAAFKMTMGAIDQRDGQLMVKNLSILEQYHRLHESIDRLRIVRGMIAAYTTENKLIIPIGIEHLHWTPIVQEATKAKEFDVEDKEVWVSGRATDLAQNRLVDLGWVVQQNCLDEVLR